MFGRSPFSRLLTLLLPLAALAACSSESVSAPPLTTTPEVISGRMAQPQLSTEYLRRTLGHFLETAQAGSLDDVLLGDRLLVITETTFSEIPSQLSGPPLLSFEISLGFGCPDECTVTVEEFLRRLSEASSQGRVLTCASPEIAALANWPSLSFRASDTTWRVSFSASGSQVVAVEVLR